MYFLCSTELELAGLRGERPYLHTGVHDWLACDCNVSPAAGRKALAQRVGGWFIRIASSMPRRD
nr:hypothetical protein Q903MT_gene2040 [Picea sitchensis]